MSLIRKFSLGILLTPFSFAQSPAGPQFEVASIRPSAPLGQGEVNVGVHIDGAQVRAVSLTLRDYLSIAYQVKAPLISGPDWTSSERFDISATLPAGSSTDQLSEMFQALLAERFKVKLHRDKKEFPVYALLVGKGPLKLKEVPPDSKDDSAEPKGTVSIAGGGSAAGVGVNLGHGSSWSFVPNRFEGKKLSMAQFAVNLERFADRPIVDVTGLKGQYDFGFDISPDDYRPMLIRSAISAGVVLPPQAMHLLDNTSSASLADAVAQTGLKLEPRKAPLDVLIVDEASKTPTAN